MIWMVLAMGVGLSSWLITKRLIAKAGHWGVVDLPNERSLHAKPVARSGGIAILLSLLIGLVTAAIGYMSATEGEDVFPKGFASESLWIVGFIMLVSVVSFLDDKKGMPVWLRLAVQAVAAAVVVWRIGLSLKSIEIPVVGTIALSVVGGLLSMLFLLWMSNLYNFMDGMDGFAGGMTVIGFGFFAYFGWLVGHPFIMLTAMLVVMSALGFLLHNFPPARIFMGDIGSVTLGFIAGIFMLLGIRDRVFDFWVPIMVFSPFILDATVTILWRAWRWERIWKPHREHYYQRLVLSGWGHRRTVVAEYGLMIVCGVLAVAYHFANEQVRLGLLSLWGALFVGLAVMVRAIEHKRLSGTSSRGEGKRFVAEHTAL